MMKVGFVCTNFNNSSYTRKAIESLKAGDRWSDVRCVVVDNASGAEDVASLQALKQSNPEVELILSPDNLGYFPGLNMGITHLRKTSPEISHMVVGNNDVEFPEDFISTVQEHKAIFDKWAVVSPDLVTPDGVHQNPHVFHPITRARRMIWDVYFFSYPTATLVQYVARVTRRFTVREENSPTSRLHETAGPVEQGYGALYLLGPVFFEHFQRLCDPTFLMQEEYFLSEQLQTIGQMMYYDPRFVVLHHHHASMGKLPSRRHWKISRDAHRIYKTYRAMPAKEQAQMLEKLSKDAP